MLKLLDKISKDITLLNLTLLGVVIVFLIVLKTLIKITGDISLRWLLIPVMMVHFLLGGILWIMGTFDSLKKLQSNVPGAKRSLILNQAYIFFYALIAILSSITRSLAS